MRYHRSYQALLFFATALTGAFAGCAPPDQFLPGGQAGEPAGALDGVVTYIGQLPCTEDDHVVGAAQMLVFDTRLLPPPEGLGTSAASLAVVGGDELFAGVRGRLTFNADGSRWCPEPGGEVVTVSANWAAAPLAAATYQVRGFYDLDGNFDPVFNIFTLPTRGDIAGGAIENGTEALQGAAPIYREIALGTLVDADAGTRRIPPEGARIGGVTVTLALPLPLERPIFHATEVVDENPDVSKRNTDPLHVKMPSDYKLRNFVATSPEETEKSLIRLVVKKGLPDSEVDTASKPPFSFPVKSPQSFHYTWQDVNGDGQKELGADHIPDSPLIASLFPVSIFGKLTDGNDVLNQALPAVIMQGLTIYKKSLQQTAAVAQLPGEFVDDQDEVMIGLRPATLCLDPNDESIGATLLVTHEFDDSPEQNPILPDIAGTTLALQKQFNRKITVKYGCLPQGHYGMNLIYETGQAWTLPNESGVCSPLEKASKDGKMCGTRARLASQAVFIEVVAPDDPAYCTGVGKTPPECLPPVF